MGEDCTIPYHVMVVVTHLPSKGEKLLNMIFKLWFKNKGWWPPLQMQYLSECATFHHTRIAFCKKADQCAEMFQVSYSYNRPPERVESRVWNSSACKWLMKAITCCACGEMLVRNLRKIRLLEIAKQLYTSTLLHLNNLVFMCFMLLDDDLLLNWNSWNYCWLFTVSNHEKPVFPWTYWWLIYDC